MRKSKIYKITVISAGNSYDEKQLFRNIFESLYSIKHLVAVSPPLFTIHDQFYTKMILLGYDVPMFKELLYPRAKPTAANESFIPQSISYAQMMYERRRWFTA